jgi:hypothetical protein
MLYHHPRLRSTGTLGVHSKRWAMVQAQATQLASVADARNAVHLHPDVSKSLFSEDMLLSKCAELGPIIAADYADKQPLLLVTLAGAYMFAADLLKRVQPCPEGLQVDFIRASSYHAATTSSGEVTTTVRSLRSLPYSTLACALSAQACVVRGASALPLASPCSRLTLCPPYAV